MRQAKERTPNWASCLRYGIERLPYKTGSRVRVCRHYYDMPAPPPYSEAASEKDEKEAFRYGPSGPGSGRSGRRAAPARGGREFRNVWLVFCGRVGIGLSASPILQKRDAPQPGFCIDVLVSAMLLPVALDMTIAVALRLVGLARLLLSALLAFLAASFAPTLVVAVTEAAHRLDHAEVVISILPIGLGLDAVPRGSCLAGQGLILVEDLVGIAANTNIRPAAIENLISIGWTVWIVSVVLLMLPVAAAAATTAAATRPLPIVWSH